ncbi:adenylate/guanylate cyclase domain-containing protein [Comamonadaceae bacterium G21597-S1]|nr:adenylate/guanylate cyclase domain-containing protein [Comamonadaceae bacterium G21597-S1]
MPTAPSRLSKLGHWLRQPVAIGLGIGLAAFLAMAGLRLLGGLQAMELAVYDLYLNARPEGGRQEDRVAVVLIDDEDIRRIGRWPMDDATLAQVAENLSQAGPQAIGFDLYRDLPVAPGTERLERLLASSEQLFFVMKFGGRDAARVSPPPVLDGTERIGFADLLVDPGGFVRRGLLFLDDGETLGFAFAWRLALPYLATYGVTPAAGEPDPEHVRLGSVTLRPMETNDGPYVRADAAGYQFPLDYQGGERPFRTFSLTEVLDRTVPPEALRGRIVLVGVSADSVKDLFLTPFNHGQSDAASTPGVLIHAHAVSQLLRAGLDGQRPLAFVPTGVGYLGMLVWSLVAVATALRVRALWLLALLATCETLALFGGSYLAFLAGWWVPVVPMALVGLVSASLSEAYLSSLERNERQYLMDIFSRQVSPDVAEEMWRSRDQFLESGRLKPRLLTATILFTDLHNFTPVAEQLSPPELMDWLNLYMDRMAGLVMQHGGVVDDYFGDAIKANFGVPAVRQDEHAIDEDARHAVRCALAMGVALEQMNRDWEAAGLPHISMRVGIATGEVVAGCLGSTQRMKFTTLGDVVNTAARMETYGKDDPAVTAPDAISRVLMSDETARRIGDGFVTTVVGDLRLKGKASPVRVYRLEGERVAGPAPS